MKKCLSRFICFLVLFFWFPSVVSFAGTITAELEQNRIAAGDQTTLTITVSGSLKGNLELPEVDGLEFQSIGTSTNVQIVNGSFSKETSYTFAVTPLKVGDFQIPSIKAEIDREKMATVPLVLKVEGVGQSGQIQAGSGQAGPGSAPQAGGPPGANPQPGSQQPVDAATPIVIQRELSKTDLYVDEVVISKVRIMHPTTLRVFSIVPEREPSPQWRIVSKEGQRSYTIEREGMPWRVLEVTEVLIPLKSGPLLVPPYAARVTYLKPERRVRPSGSIWDMFNGAMMGGQEVAKKISSEPQKLTIKALPTTGKPTVSSDIVGLFSLTADVSKRELEAGETATVSINIAGLGALDRMAEIKMPALIGAKIYQDKPQLKEQVTDRGLESERQIRFAVVPSSAGELELGQVELGAFDPIAASWKVLKVDLGKIKSLGATQAAQGSNNLASQTAPANGADAKLNTAPQAVENANTNHNQPPIPQIPGLKVEGGGDASTWPASKVFLWASILVGFAAVGFASFAVYRKSKGSSSSKRRDFLQLKKDVLAQNSLDLKAGQEMLSLLKQHLLKWGALRGSVEAATAKDISAALKLLGMPDEIISEIESAAGNVEAVPYRGRELSSEEVAALKSALLKLCEASPS